MAVLEALLALIGLGLLILLAIGALAEKAPAPPSDDPATPYREGLRAAIRMQVVAQDLEQQIYAEAARHMDADTDRP
ncbi:MAG: hypothetical protein WA484_00875 [Solirubrobacteraceae bacterium]